MQLNKIISAEEFNECVEILYQNELKQEENNKK
jgi:hypothetical protein